MRKEIKSLALIGLMAASASAFKIEASGLDEWGLAGAAKDGIIVPDADVFSGGSSAVLDASGALVGPCPKDDATCTANWDMSGTFVEVDFVTQYFSSSLKITDFVPASKAGWGWATSGWWVVPAYDATASGETAFDKAGPAGLTASSWISMAVSYSAGQTLTIQLKGSDIDEDDGQQSPPRFSYKGTGAFELVNFPMIAVKRAGWSSPADYDAAQVNGIGLLRMEAALAEGAQFPSSAPETTKFELACISSGSAKGDNACALPGNVSTTAIQGAIAGLDVDVTSSAVTFVGASASFQAEIVSVNGEVLRTADISSASNSISTEGLTSGAYFVKAQGEALRITK
ncbi:T9SS type A sorting domain-containing protein [Fibrobacterales bacterium]|nr:T9SS type A sorting domain-containing protein [Fibrobacterales bacterium]